MSAQKDKATLTRLLHAVVSSDQPLAENVLRGTWRHALKKNDHELMVKVIARADLPSDILQQAKSRSDMPSRVAYLNRAATSSKERSELLAGETRSGVLAGVLAGPNGHELALLIQDRLQAKPTVGLAKAVICMDADLPAALSAQALAIAGWRKDLTWQLVNGLRRRVKEVKEDSHAAELLITSLPPTMLPTVELLEVISVNGVSDSARLKFVSEQLVPAAHRLASAPSDYHTGRRVTFIVNSLTAAEDLSEAVITTARRALDKLPQAAKLVQALDQYSSKADNPSRPSSKAEQAATTSDQDEIRWLSASMNLEVGRALLANPAVTGDARQEVIRNFAQKSEAAAVEMLSMHPGDEDVALLVYAANTTVIHVDKWAAFADPHQARIALLNAAVAKGSGHGTLSLLDRILGTFSTDEERQAQKHLPWSVYDIVTRGWMSQDTRGHLVATLAQELDLDDQEAWDNLEVLAENFQGSLQELLAVVRTL